MQRFSIYVAIAGCLLTAAIGCQRPTTKPGTNDVPAIPVSYPVQRSVTDYVYYTGRTNPVKSVVVQARVTGNLVKTPFKEGADVKKGALLFEIDPAPYKALHEAALAQVAQYEANLKYATATNKRYKELAKKTEGAVSEKALDQYQALEEQAIAFLNLAQANLVSAKLNLDWTKVYSPIDGHISRYYLTPGNLVNQDMTQLTTVVSMDPMFVYFDMDEPTMLRVKDAINKGSISPVIEGSEPFPLYVAATVGNLTSPLLHDALQAAFALVGAAALAEVPVWMGLQGEDGYPRRGTIDFLDNQVNPATGSISVRGVFSNPKPARGTNLMVPGMFVRIQLPMGRPHPALLVIDRAVTSDQGIKYVFVVDADNKVAQRRVTTGSLQEDGLRVITDGLKANDRVVVGALQQVSARMTIQPDLLATMPSLAPLKEKEAAPEIKK